MTVPGPSGDSAGQPLNRFFERHRILARVISRLDDNPSASMVCLWSSVCQSTRPPIPASTTGFRSARTAAPSTRTGCRRTPARTPRSPPRSHPRSGSASAATKAAACGRRAHGSVQLSLASKNSATITPRPATSSSACSQLPGPRRHRFLPVLGRHPPVKREPHTPRPCLSARPPRPSAHAASRSLPGMRPPSRGRAVTTAGTSPRSGGLAYMEP